MIYAYAIGGHEIHVMYSKGYGTLQARTGLAWPCKELWDSLLSLSLVCRQLNHETKQLPYELNTFCLEGVSTYSLLRMKAAKEKLITTISIGLFNSNNGLRVLGQLKHCIGLKTLIWDYRRHPGQRKLLGDFAKKYGVDLVYSRDLA